MSAEPPCNPETIRRAQYSDASSVAELLTALGYPSSAAQVERRIVASLTTVDTAGFVAESGERAVGLLSFHCIPLFHADGLLGRITSLIVAPEYRERGIGRLLVAAAEDFARAHNCIRLEVTSGDHRPDAHAFYERLGYKVASRRFIKHVPAPSAPAP
jgi:ribosomal protein S18 acetylase RimI-like enzyme